MKHGSSHRRTVSMNQQLLTNTLEPTNRQQGRPLEIENRQNVKLFNFLNYGQENQQPRSSKRSK